MHLMVKIRELNCRPLLFEGATPIFSETSRRPALDVSEWSPMGILGPQYDRGSRVQICSADWGSSVHFFRRPGFHTTPAFPGGRSLTFSIRRVLQATP
jgi:hypothetical protein